MITGAIDTLRQLTEDLYEREPQLRRPDGSQYLGFGRELTVDDYSLGMYARGIVAAPEDDPTPTDVLHQLQLEVLVPSHDQLHIQLGSIGLHSRVDGKIRVSVHGFDPEHRGKLDSVVPQLGQWVVGAAKTELSYRTERTQAEDLLRENNEALQKLYAESKRQGIDLYTVAEAAGSLPVRPLFDAPGPEDFAPLQAFLADDANQHTFFDAYTVQGRNPYLLLRNNVV